MEIQMEEQKRRTTSPSKGLRKVIALRRRGHTRVRTEYNLTVTPSTEKSKDHGSKHLCSGLAYQLPVTSISIRSLGTGRLVADRILAHLFG